MITLVSPPFLFAKYCEHAYEGESFQVDQVYELLAGKQHVQLEKDHTKLILRSR